MRYLLLLLFPLGVLAQPQLPTYELDHRIQLSVDRLTDPIAHPAFTYDFLLADVRLNPADPRRFYNFSGDLSGRYLEVMSLLPSAKQSGVHLRELVQQIMVEQQADGRFGDGTLQYTAGAIGGEHMALLWGNGRLLVGLMTYYQRTNDAAALAAARRLGDFFITTAAASRSPEIAERLKGFGAKGIICFTQYIEGLTMLAAATGEERYVQAAEDAYTVLPERGEVHTHGYLTTLRGVLMLYEITQDPTQLAYVKATFDDLLASEDYSRHGAVYEYFGGHGDRDEGCSSADFVRLAFHLHALTQDEHYLAVAEEGLLNALFYNQYENGDFGNHFFTDGGISPSNPRRAWWCCTMHGLRALLEVRDRYLVTQGKGATHLNLLVTTQYRSPDIAFDVQQDRGPDNSVRYLITFIKWDGSALRLRVPANSSLSTTAVQPRTGDSLALLVTHEVKFHQGQDRQGGALPERKTTGYLTYGPYLMGITQDDFVAEPDWGNQISWKDLRPGTFPLSLTAAYRHGGYPGLHPVTLLPIAYQPYFGHPYLRVTTAYSETIVPTSAD